MIIVLSPGDAQIIQQSRDQSYNFPDVYGATYVMTKDKIPPLDEGEDLFFIGHGIEQGDSGNAEIGDESGVVALDGMELWDNFKDIFPDMYEGRVFVDACKAANFAQGMFSLIEVFRSQSDIGLGDGVGIYGRSGIPVGDIPSPDDLAWRKA